VAGEGNLNVLYLYQKSFNLEQSACLLRFSAKLKDLAPLKTNPCNNYRFIFLIGTLQNVVGQPYWLQLRCGVEGDCFRTTPTITQAYAGT
jgi:hypothetical protein